MLAGQRKTEYDALNGTELLEFWGIVWEWEKSNKRKLKHYRENASRVRPDSES